MHRYDEFITNILLKKHDTMEAREWLQTAGPDYGVIHELSHEESIDVVEEAYRRGASKVEAMGNFGKGMDCSVDWILITLPKTPAYREMLFEFEEIVARTTGFEGSIDEGQQYLLLRWT